MDIPCAHAPCVKGDYFFFDAGNIPLVFGNKLWLKLPVAVPGDIKRELSKLAFDSFLRIPIAFVVCVQPSLVVFAVTKGGIHLCFEEFLKNIFETIAEEGVDICHAGDVVF